MERFQPNGMMTHITMFFLGTMIASYIAALVSSIMQYDMIITLMNGGQIPSDVIQSNNSRETAIWIISLIAFLAAAYYFYLWRITAYENLSLKKLDLPNKELWEEEKTSWYSFPIIPYNITKDIFDETRDLLFCNGLISSDRLSTNLFWVWWATYLLSQVVGRIVTLISADINSLPEWRIYTIAHIIFNIIGMIFTIYTFKLIRDYYALEPLLIRVPDAQEQYITAPPYEESEAEV